MQRLLKISVARNCLEKIN